jgi:hypothetical protein
MNLFKKSFRRAVNFSCVALCLGYSALCLGADLTPQLSSPAASGTSDDPYCTVTGDALKFMSPGTRKMASILEKLAQTANPRGNPFLNRERAQMYQEDLLLSTNDSKIVLTRAQMGIELLNAGEPLRAIEIFQGIQNLRRDHPSEAGTRFLAEVSGYEALANLRIGEQENCLTNHNILSCIFPIQSGGVHQVQRGSRKAIQILEDQLRRSPRDRKNVWLLNIAYMTVGEYPDKVPLAWRIPPEVFKSEHEMKPFTDIAGNLGLDVNDLAGGTITEDFDGDGYLDILIYFW